MCNRLVFFAVIVMVQPLPAAAIDDVIERPVAPPPCLVLSCCSQKHALSPAFPLHTAVRHGCLSCVRGVFAQYDVCTDEVNQCNMQGSTPLFIAVAWADPAREDAWLAVISELLYRGANARVRNKHGTTLVHCAAEQGILSVVKLLVGAGALDDDDYWAHEAFCESRASCAYRYSAIIDFLSACKEERSLSVRKPKNALI